MKKKWKRGQRIPERARIEHASGTASVGMRAPIEDGDVRPMTRDGVANTGFSGANCYVDVVQTVPQFVLMPALSLRSSLSERLRVNPMLSETQMVVDTAGFFV